VPAVLEAFLKKRCADLEGDRITSDGVAMPLTELGNRYRLTEADGY
jgi:hypothetical protein